MRLERIPWVDDTPLFDRKIVLLLDEIDIHLHPAWQRRILPVVQDLFPKAQVFVSTHSPFVIASARDAFIYPLVLEGARATAGARIEAVPGWSYQHVTRDILGVEEDFDVDVEQKLDEFYALRDAVLARKQAFIELARHAQELSALGPEVGATVAAEIVQVQRALRARDRA